MKRNTGRWRPVARVSLEIPGSRCVDRTHLNMTTASTISLGGREGGRGGPLTPPTAHRFLDFDWSASSPRSALYRLSAIIVVIYRFTERAAVVFCRLSTKGFIVDLWIEMAFYGRLLHIEIAMRPISTGGCAAR